MNNLFPLLLTLGVGIFIVIGVVLTYFSKNNDKFLSFTVSMAFGVMVSLALVELIPESFELLSPIPNTILTIVFYTSVGFIGLTALDKLIPHHDHGHHEHDGEEHNMAHIGIIASIALILHNIIEGMALFATAKESLKVGALVALGIGLHNIPMGMIVTSSFIKGNQSKQTTIINTIIISLSTFFGGMIMFIMRNKMLNNHITGILICLTLGMLIYIAFMELLPQMLCKEHKKLNIIGVVSGIIILLASQLF